MIVEQVTDGYAQAVVFSVPEDGVHGTTMTIQSKTELKRPRSELSNLCYACAGGSGLIT